MSKTWHRCVLGARYRDVRVSSAMCLFFLGASAQAADPCKIPGIWTDSFSGRATLDSALTGLLKYPYCPQQHSLSASANGSTGFTVRATYTGSSECQSVTYNLSFAGNCKSASGTFVNADGSSGNDTWNREGPDITLARSSLLKFVASGSPAGGTFDVSTSLISGGNIASVVQDGGSTPTSNPDALLLQAPAHSGAPTPGGLAKVIAKYAVNGLEAKSDTNTVATFGMSCYMVALESDYGTAPNSCTSTRIAGVTYAGSVTNPNGLTGTYCKSFIANVRLQGTGQFNDGTYGNYDVGSGNINVVTSVTGADGTAVVAGGSVARDRAIIPGRGVLVDVDGVGVGLLANDTGGAIRGYRLDLFNGAGRAACASYSNPIGVGACQTAQGSTCPARDFK